jgi:hypothetical protein
VGRTDFRGIETWSNHSFHWVLRPKKMPMSLLSDWRRP